MVEEHFLADGPESVGLDPGKVRELFERAEREIREGLLPSCQLAIARDGRIGAVKSLGRVTRMGVESDASDDTLYTIFSSTKAIVSSATWLLLQEGKLDLDELVGDIVPEFATNGKEGIRVEQLLTHTAGFPHAPFRPLDWNDRATRLARFGRWRLNWEPGSQFEYHPSSGMWMLAEIIERRAGMDFRRFIRSRIALPLGLPDLYLGLPGEAEARVADLVHVGEEPSAEELRVLGFPAIPITEVTEEALQRFNRSDFRTVGVPGGGGITGAAEMALFYQALLNGGCAHDGTRVWSEEILESARRVRTGDMRDPYTGKLVHRGLGISIAGDDDRHWRGFGKTNSPEAFGHNGAGGQIAWADPATGISFTYCTTGFDRHPLRLARRSVGLSSRAALCAAR
ncbi:MAG: serine hydrolase [Proteobacteria bacterium]|nr:serine hydrolase [Pseudomonadota bacterium]